MKLSEAATEAELKLLLGPDETEEEFVPEATDKRFNKLGTGAFALDPTDKKFAKAGTTFIQSQHEK